MASPYFDMQVPPVFFLQPLYHHAESVLGTEGGRGSRGVEIDTHEACHRIDILDSHYIHTIMDVYATYEVLRLFE